MNTGLATELADTGNDTRIQVEKSVDEDIIRFDLAGTEQFRMVDRRFEPNSSNTYLGQNVGLNQNYASPDSAGNVGVGFQALKLNSSGDQNTAIGRQALEDNTTGTSNTAIGSRALGNNISASENTAVGTLALRLSSGDRNTAVGFEALTSNTIGSENTAIGYGADVGLGELVNATAIGAYSFVGASNSLVLGNGANVGISTSNPRGTLDLAEPIQTGDIWGVNKVIGKDKLQFYTNNLGTGTPAVRIAQNGNTGIGTSSPNHRLEVQGGNIALNRSHLLRFLRADGTDKGNESSITYAESFTE